MAHLPEAPPFQQNEDHCPSRHNTKTIS